MSSKQIDHHELARCEQAGPFDDKDRMSPKKLAILLCKLLISLQDLLLQIEPLAIYGLVYIQVISKQI